MASSDHLTHSIVGLGNPLLDISADVTPEFLEKYGLKINNAILADETHAPMFKEIVDNLKPAYIAGGATQNSIRVAQWMLNKHNKTATSFFGCVGKDAHGAKLKECAQADGVNVSYLENDDIKTGTCAVCVVDTERSLIADLSAANHFHHDHLAKKESEEIINQGKFFYSAGFHLTVSPTSVMKLAEHAKANNKVFMINLSAPFIAEFFKDPLMAAISYADFVVGNESEALAFGKVQGWGEDIKEIALKTAQLEKASGVRCRTVVFTQGAEATIVVHEGEVHTFDVPKMDAKSIVDTNGAGDAFVGGFISRLALGLSLQKCVEAGHWSAQVVLARSGCTFPETASKSNGYQGFKSFAVQHCSTLKPGESYEQRATKFSSMGSHIIAPPMMNRIGKHAHESVAMQSGQLVQPEDYRVPDRRGVSVNEKRPEAKPFIAATTYQHDFPAFDDERIRVLHVSLEDYEKAFLAVAETNSQRQPGAPTIQLAQVQEVLKIALGDGSASRALGVFFSYLDRRGSARDRITWDLFCQAITHADNLFERELNHKTTGKTDWAWGPTFAEQQLNASLVHSSTAASTHNLDYGIYGDNPRDRPYMRKRGMASTTSDLNAGTTRITNQIPGYAGFLPVSTHSAQAIAQANGPEDIESLRPIPPVSLRLFHSENVPGYTGHKPADCANYRGECRAGSDLGTTTGDSYKPHK
ncbi:hypothetical protein JM18_000596 [Phytophthora kernoviae]|uniref:Adenosine kinase n=2 Tax=Phytophthora kernoviae TaxID=325452 RepID=A0A8T0MBJ7_9STRA|nr:hypothetical protein G195_001466 [Phytophthora kernoviae 00238/432]KAG2532168.1 hypothetical protein JM16_000515 [Phytophthora kernoviae]KAG2533220.1 hypothetical protein JM18_000596 [Phytophthora kernoviae]